MVQTIQSGNVIAKIKNLGGELTSFAKDGKEYLWQGDPAFWENQAPILFPVVGRMQNGVVSIKGKDYPMPKHGFVPETELEVLDKTEDSVTFSLTQNAVTKRHYPWDFRFSVQFTLNGSRLTWSFRVENTDQEPIFFGLGGHPAFRVPIEEGEKFEDYQLEFEKEEVLYSNHLREDIAIMAEEKDLILESGNVLPLRRSLFNNDAMIFEDIASKWVNLVHKDTKKGIHFAYQDFPVLAVWTKGEPVDAPYLCLEPWFSMGFRDDDDGSLETKYGIRSLQPGEVFTAAFSAEIMD